MSVGNSEEVQTQVRVRQYYERNGASYYVLRDWVEVNGAGEQTLDIPVDSYRVAGKGRTYVEWRFARRGGGSGVFVDKGIDLRNVRMEELKVGWYTKTVYSCEEEDNYRFGFNGKEKDNEVKGKGNSLDFGARIFDPRLGRWMSLDPLAAKYPSLSAYHFGANNPIVFIDPDGKKIVNGEKVNTKNYDQMESFLKTVKQTNKEAFEKVDASPIDVTYVFGPLNPPSTSSMPDPRETGGMNYENEPTSEHYGRTEPNFKPDASVKGIGNITKDADGNITGGSILRQRMGDQQDAFRKANENTPEIAAKAHEPYPMSDEEAEKHVEVKSVRVTIDERFATSSSRSDKKEGGRTVAHELGHVFNALFNTAKDYMWSRPAMQSPGRHGTNDPSGKKADAEQQVYNRANSGGMR